MAQLHGNSSTRAFYNSYRIPRCYRILNSVLIQVKQLHLGPRKSQNFGAESGGGVPPARVHVHRGFRNPSGRNSGSRPGLPAAVTDDVSSRIPERVPDCPELLGRVQFVVRRQSVGLADHRLEIGPTVADIFPENGRIQGTWPLKYVGQGRSCIR